MDLCRYVVCCRVRAKPSSITSTKPRPHYWRVHFFSDTANYFYTQVCACGAKIKIVKYPTYPWGTNIFVFVKIWD